MSPTLNFLTTLGPIISIIGTYLLILSYQKKNEIVHTIQKGLSTEGTIVEIKTYKNDSSGSNVKEAFAPVVEFTTINGKYLHFSPTFRSPSRYEIGQKVKIYYYFYKSRREMALADDVPGTLPNTLLKWGVIFCIIGYPVLIFKMSGLF